MLEDKLLTVKFKHGSPDALRRIYEKYRLYLLKIAIALLHDVHAGEDVVHDVFIHLAQSAQTLSINGSLKAYLRVCVINGVRNKIRSDRVRTTVELNDDLPIASHENAGEQWAILREETLRISNALAQIPFEQREVVVLRLQGEMKFRQIAKLQNVSTKTIQSRHRYGMDKLRSILNHEVTK
jgi:RNA polymerase sigma factor (sigma-70 family)